MTAKVDRNQNPPTPVREEPSLQAPNHVPLETVVRLPRNSKAHDIGQIDASVKAFGWLEPITVNVTTGRMIAGHGRVDYLQQQKASGAKPPTGIQVEGTSWLVPVHYVELAAEKEEAAAIALNRTGELGGWDDAALASMLSDLAAQDALEGTGFDGEDLDRLLQKVNPQFSPVGIEEQGRLDQKKPITCPACGHEFIPKG